MVRFILLQGEYGNVPVLYNDKQTFVQSLKGNHMRSIHKLKTQQ